MGKACLYKKKKSLGVGGFGFLNRGLEIGKAGDVWDKEKVR